MPGLLILLAAPQVFAAEVDPSSDPRRRHGPCSYSRSVDRCSVAVALFCWCWRAVSSCRRCSARFLSVAHVTSLVLSHDSRALQFSLQLFSSVRMFSVAVGWSGWSHTAATMQHHPRSVRRPSSLGP